MKLGPVVLLGLLSLGCDKASKQPASKEPAPSAPFPASAPASAAPSTSSPPKPTSAPRPVPTSLDAVPVPQDNPLTPEKVELGRLLFFDKRLSSDGALACASCHTIERGTGGREPLAVGAQGKPLGRHAPVLWNAAFLPALGWDGAAASLEEQTRLMWAGDALGVGEEKLAEKAASLSAIEGYRTLFEKAFPGQGATAETVVQALASYQRSLVCKDTAYDRYVKGDQKALTETQKKGLELFSSKAACAACHTPPFFTIAAMTPTGTYFNVGVGFQGKKEEEVDTGRMAVTKEERDFAAFKPPTLRDISKSFPYFHDGSVEKLEDAVRAMSNGGHPNKNLTPIMTDRQLSNAEVAALVAFLKALDCPNALEAPKKLP